MLICFRVVLCGIHSLVAGQRILSSQLLLFSCDAVSLPVHVTGVGDFIAEKIEVVYGDAAGGARLEKRKLRLAAAEGERKVKPVEDCDMEGGYEEGQHTGHEVQEDEEPSPLPCLDEESLTEAQRRGRLLLDVRLP